MYCCVQPDECCPKDVRSGVFVLCGVGWVGLVLFLIPDKLVIAKTAF